jgi:hypothetical protein
MWASAIVVDHELLDDPAQVPFVEWYQEVQAFPPNGPDQPFTECVRLGRSDRRLGSRRHSDAQLQR